MKKIVSILLAVMLMASLTVGCGKSTPDDSEGGSSSEGSSSSEGGSSSESSSSSKSKIQLTFWAGLTGDDQQAMADLVTKFNGEQDRIQVDWYSVTWGEIFTKLSAASNTDVGPDVMLMHPTDLATYAEKEMIVSLDDLIDGMDLNATDYSDTIWSGNQVNGAQYGIPIDFHSMGMFINLDKFEEAGLTIEDAKVTSIDEFNALCEKLSGDGQYAIGLGSNYAHTYRYFYGLLHQASGKFLNDDMTKAEFNSDAGVEALDFLASWVNSGYAPEAEADIDADWLGQTTAMVIEGPWFVPTAMSSDINFATVEFPQVFGENAVWGSSHTITVPRYDGRTEEETEAIQEFVSWLVANSFEWGAASGQIPANKTVFESEAYRSLELYQYAQAFIDEASYVVYEPLCPGTSEFGADNELSAVANAVYSVIAGEDDTLTALDKAAESVNTILE